MIDLHTHTTASDGTCSPAQLVELASKTGLVGLAITDHDTFAGYEEAAPVAKSAGLDLVCAIEVSTQRATANGPRGRSVHLLGYFPGRPPTPEFREWLKSVQSARRDRNRRLVEQLNRLGVDIQLWEVERAGRKMTGRPHFARVLVEKGYAKSYPEAFERYLEESAQAYVERLSPSTMEGIERIREGGGLAVLAHPVRLGASDRDEEEKMIRRWVDSGLQGIEAYHSDHSATDVARYLEFTKRLSLLATGGSDFHGDIKPGIRLGAAQVPSKLLDDLRELASLDNPGEPQ